MAVTIYDIANKTGVSIATVSKVLNNKPGVSKKTIDKINLAIKEMNYHPNKAASSLSTKKSMTLGLIIPEISNPLYGEISKQIETAARNLNYGLTICSSNTYDGEINRYIDFLLDSGVDGIIICSFIHKPQTLKKLKNLTIPIILLVTERRDEEYTTINIDDQLTAYNLVGDLAKKGQQNITLFAESTLKNSSRIEGYERGIRQFNLKSTVISLGFDSTSYEETMCEFFKTHSLPQIIICCSDLIAMHLVRFCITNNIDIPKTCQIISYGGVFYTSLFSPSITSVVEPLKEMCTYAVTSIIQSLESENSQPKTRIIFDAELVKRETTLPD